METDLGKEGAFLNDVFFCPHHPHKGYKGEISELKIDCDCRKPKIGMLQRAAVKYNIDLTQSWYVGDTTMDIQTGINAGMRTVLVKTGEAGQDGKYDAIPTAVKENLLEAADYILKSK
jgi:histidinol-phosphate phosphatase family protein